MHRLSFFFLLFIISNALVGQSLWTDSVDLDVVIQDIYNVMQEQSESTDESTDFSLLQSELQSRLEHPIYLPTACREDFASLHFLSAQQIDNILFFIYQHQNSLVSLGQLQLIPGLSDYELRDLLPFCTLMNPSVDSIKVRPLVHQELLAQVKWTNEARGNRYGDPLAERLQYHLETGTWSVGLKMEKDAFEPYYLKTRTWGADFYGGYVQWSPHRVVDRIVVGDFLVNYGSGLVVRQTPSLYSSSFIDQPSDGIKGYNGLDEYRFMRGIGTSFRKGDWKWGVFYSIKDIDAFPENGVVSVFSKTGYHRTLTELNRKNQSLEQQAGLHVEWSCGGWQLGATVVGDFLLDTLRMKLTYYNQNYFSGTYCVVGGLSYRYQHNWYSLFGETAMSSQGGVATQNGVHMQVNYHWALESSIRYYSRRFDNPLADAYGAFSRANDERGWLLQMVYTPKHELKCVASTDIFDYSFPKYGIREPGWGWRAMATADWLIRQDLLFSSQLRWVNKAQQIQNGIGLIKLRLRWITDTWRLSTQLAGSLSANPSNNSTSLFHAGVSAVEQVRYSFRYFPLYFEGELAYVYAPNYETRMYIYEPGGLGYGYSAMLYGNGVRAYLDGGYVISVRQKRKEQLAKIKLFSRVSYNQLSDNRLQVEFQLKAEF